MIAPIFSIAPIIFIAVLLAAPLAIAQGNHDDAQAALQKIESDLAVGTREQARLDAQRRTLIAQETALRQQLAAAAASAQETETALTALEAQIAALATRESDKTARLAAQQTQLSALLAALLSITRQPPHGLVVGRGSGADTVRSAILLSKTIPAIEAEAETLRIELQDLLMLRTEIAARRQDAATAAEALAAERDQISDMLAAKEALMAMTAAERRTLAQRLAVLADEAQSIRELLARLAAQRLANDAPPPARPAALAARASDPMPSDSQQTAAQAGLPPIKTPQSSMMIGADHIRPFPEATIGVTPPARGTVQRAYGEELPLGGTSKGIEIATRAGAQLVTPFDGQIVFAGPFRGYGRILIIEHKGGYHTLLSGMEHIDAVVGGWVLAGEPVGTMGGSSNDNNNGGAPRLYIELRRRGKPINPIPWLASLNEKVTG